MVSWQAFPSLPPSAPLAFPSRPKPPFPSLSNACHAGYTKIWKKNQQNGGRISQEALRVPIPLQWGRFLRGGLISGRPANRFGMNAKLLRGVVSLISTPNDDLNTAFHIVVSLRRSCRNNAPPRSSREKLQLDSVVSLRVKSLSLTRKEYAICRSPPQIEAYSPGTRSLKIYLSATSDRNEIEI